MTDQEPTQVSFSPFSDYFSLPQKFAILIVTFFFVGLIPIAPGTFGSLAALGIYYLIAVETWQVQLQVILLILLIGTGSIAILQKKTGPRDDGRIVIDEVVGMLIAVTTFPAHWTWLLAGFLVFRLFDIWKPFPARYIDRHLHGAWGVMLDDVVAGIYTLAFLKVVESLRIFV